jgi:excisionase family DNA binding protein
MESLEVHLSESHGESQTAFSRHYWHVFIFITSNSLVKAQNAAGIIYTIDKSKYHARIPANWRKFSDEKATKRTSAQTHDGELLDIPAVAEKLGGSERAIREQIGRGTLPARRFGGRVVVRRKDLEKFLENLPAA